MKNEDETRYEPESVNRRPVLVDISPTVDFWSAGEVSEVVSEVASDPRVAEALNWAIEVVQGLA